jgi:hypothetical protein
MLANSPLMKKLSKRTVKNIERCSSCVWSKFCGGGCTAASYGLFRKLDREGDRCRYEAMLFEGLIWKLIENQGNYLHLMSCFEYSSKVPAILREPDLSRKSLLGHIIE